MRRLLRICNTTVKMNKQLNYDEIGTIGEVHSALEIVPLKWNDKNVPAFDIICECNLHPALLCHNISRMNSIGNFLYTDPLLKICLST
jgi:hypothetical protein